MAAPPRGDVAGECEASESGEAGGTQDDVASAQPGPAPAVPVTSWAPPRAGARMLVRGSRVCTGLPGGTHQARMDKSDDLEGPHRTRGLSLRLLDVVRRGGRAGRTTSRSLRPHGAQGSPVTGTLSF